MWKSRHKLLFVATAVILVAMAIYPPYAVTVVREGDYLIDLSKPIAIRDWIWASPRNVDLEALLFQWVGVIAVAAILSGLLSARRYRPIAN